MYFASCNCWVYLCGSPQRSGIEESPAPKPALETSSAPAEGATPRYGATRLFGDGDDGAACFEKRVALVGSSGGGAAAQG